MSETGPIPWLSLVRRLTQVSPDWGVWKNADSALAGQGDIDSVSSPIDRSVLLREFQEWVLENGFLPVCSCTHIPGVVLAVALRDGADLVELDLCEVQPFRGFPLFGAAELKPLMTMDSRGFRRLRPGAEGLLLLFMMGMRTGGRIESLALERKSIPALLRGDREGVSQATSLFGPARKSASRLAEAVVAGGWDQLSAVKVELWSAIRAMRNPRLLSSRLSMRLTLERRCPLWPVIRDGRRLEGDVQAWLSVARAAHEGRGSI